MFKLKILSVGKTKEVWLEEAIKEYVKRLTPLATLEFIWAKNDAQLLQFADKETALICLEVEGNSFTSEQFADFFSDQLQKGGSRLTFVIGGSDGLPKALKQRATLISLSPLTFTHQLARLVLIEQIYRAFEILKGSRYHK